MQALIDQGTESPSFHVRHDEKQRLCLLRRDSRHSTLDTVRTGDLLPLDRGAAGRVLLAFGEQGAATPASVPRILVSRGERDPLCGAVAAPVFGAAGELVGALSLSGPLDRFSVESIERMSGLLREAADAAGRALGAVEAR
jgi:DNA-binding IclR family transcriptional regulator